MINAKSSQNISISMMLLLGKTNMSNKLLVKFMVVFNK